MRLDVPSLVDLEPPTTGLHSNLFCAAAAVIFVQLFITPAVGIPVLGISLFRSLSSYSLWQRSVHRAATK